LFYNNIYLYIYKKRVCEREKKKERDFKYIQIH